MRFYKFLQEAAHTHSAHVEELFLSRGKEGLDAVLVALEDIVSSLGSTNPPISLKVDGNPAVIAGYISGSFFVATKSLFNKDPKIMFSNADIDRIYPSGPNEQLKLALKYFPQVIPKGKIYQGDFLFSKDSLKVSGNTISFHPNTIIYTVDKNSDIGKQILQSKVGVAFHTEYISTSDDPKSITLKGFGVKTESTKDVFCLSLNIENVSSDIAFTSSERSQYNTLVKQAKSINVPWDLVTKYKNKIPTYNNQVVRSGTYGKLNAKQMALDFGQPDAEPIFELLLTLLRLKELVMNKLQKISNLKTFVQKTDGSLEVTSHEGYCVMSGPANSTKLVDRLSFSRNNFSADIVKSWAHP